MKNKECESNEEFLKKLEEQIKEIEKHTDLLNQNGVALLAALIKAKEDLQEKLKQKPG
jgi:hypothetical protein